MPVYGTFVINNKKNTTLSIGGVGDFIAYSGSGSHRNKTSSIAIPYEGPIPPGKYYIVKRPSLGLLGVLRNDLGDMTSWLTSTPTLRGEWFALYRDDGDIDDFTWIEGVKRGKFRLHPRGVQGISQGCITLENRSDFLTIRQNILMTKTFTLPGGMVSYGEIEVIFNEE